MKIAFPILDHQAFLEKLFRLLGLNLAEHNQLNDYCHDDHNQQISFFHFTPPFFG
jgi:hypothetical protein